ncbi:guanylate cyclase activator 2B [Choloepus didactylus]|uniref:guanylate cyclase activator 2B n=1 Tax=Choloepus didactylus TaxID=27675 RepID=UPI0018A0E558|nr:guanylate cyclase activator 2B [Choloepus didactylus]
MGSGTASQLLSGVAMVLLVLLQGTQSIYIQYRGFQVQLESVKKLSGLGTQRMQSLLPALCHHPALPLDLQPVCASQNATSIFRALRDIASDDCELCVNIACTGCT